MNKSELIQAVASGIVIRNGKPLQLHEKTYLANRMKKLDLAEFKGQSVSSIITALVELTSAELLKLPKQRTEGPIDIREMQIKELGRDSEAAQIDKHITDQTTITSLLKTPKLLQSVFSPNALLRKAYIILDRKFQSEDSNNSTAFKWNITNSSKTCNPLTTAQTVAPIKDVVSMRMFPFIFPNSEHTISGIRRLSVEIVEFNNQAYIASAYNRRVHFSFAITSTGISSPYSITDVGQTDSTYDFQDAIRDVDTMTIQFGNPNHLITLDPDVLYGTIAAVGAQTVITFTQPHYSTVADFITIRGFNTTDPLGDAAEIALINDIYGWIIAANTTFTITINVDLSGLVGVIDGSPFYVYLESKRFELRLELTYII